MADVDQGLDSAALRARIDRLREVARAADRASLQIDTEIRSLEPQVNNMQEAAAALTTLVNLTGAVQRELVTALNALEPGDAGTAPAADED